MYQTFLHPCKFLLFIICALTRSLTHFFKRLKHRKLLNNWYRTWRMKNETPMKGLIIKSVVVPPSMVQTYRNGCIWVYNWCNFFLRWVELFSTFLSYSIHLTLSLTLPLKWVTKKKFLLLFQACFALLVNGKTLFLNNFFFYENWKYKFKFWWKVFFFNVTFAWMLLWNHFHVWFAPRK